MLFRSFRFEQRAHFSHQPYDGRFGNGPPVELDALTEGDQVRGGKEPHAQPRLAVDALEHGAGGPLAVGAGHMNEAESLLRIAAKGSQPEAIGEAELGAKPAEAIQELDGVWIGQRLVKIGLFRSTN